MVHDPGKGLALLDELETDSRIANHHRLHAVRAHLLELNRNFAEAITHYRAAAARTGSLPERNYLLTQAAQLERK